MNDLRELFERQAAWQERQRHLSWPEKVRMVQATRETLLTFRRLRVRSTLARQGSGPPDTHGNHKGAELPGRRRHSDI